MGGLEAVPVEVAILGRMIKALRNAQTCPGGTRHGLCADCAAEITNVLADVEVACLALPKGVL